MKNKKKLILIILFLFCSVPLYSFFTKNNYVNLINSIISSELKRYTATIEVYGFLKETEIQNFNPREIDKYEALVRADLLKKVTNGENGENEFWLSKNGWLNLSPVNPGVQFYLGAYEASEILEVTSPEYQPIYNEKIYLVKALLSIKNIEKLASNEDVIKAFDIKELTKDQIKYFVFFDGPDERTKVAKTSEHINSLLRQRKISKNRVAAVRSIRIHTPDKTDGSYQRMVDYFKKSLKERKPTDKEIINALKNSFLTENLAPQSKEVVSFKRFNYTTYPYTKVFVKMVGNSKYSQSKKLYCNFQTSFDRVDRNLAAAFGSCKELF